MRDIRQRIRIAVIGGSRPGRQALETAFEVGRLIARAVTDPGAATEVANEVDALVRRYPAYAQSAVGV